MPSMWYSAAADRGLPASTREQTYVAIAAPTRIPVGHDRYLWDLQGSNLPGVAGSDPTGASRLPS